MSFLQPLILVALPLISLPIIIHLINQRRYQTVQWAAMMFLLAANRMSRGYARLRQLLIMLFRMVVIAGLVFAVSRPLASGWIGVTAGGRAETTLVLVDRSPSMQETSTGSQASKREILLGQLAATLSTLGGSRWVLIDSVNGRPVELDSPQALTSSPNVALASASADLPALLQTAYDYIQANRTGRTDIWICSDQQAGDWNATSGRWPSLRASFADLKQGVRIHLLSSSEKAAGNTSVRVTGVRRRATSDGAELLVSLHLARDDGDESKRTIPLQFEIDGARSEFLVEMSGAQYDIKDHPIPLGDGKKRGWGRVSIPADVNSADNDFYFVYDETPPRYTVLVADDPQAVRPQQLAAEITTDPSQECKTEGLAPDDLAGVEWEKVALLVWQAPLPQGDTAAQVRSYVDRGGVAIFFPPASPDETEFCGVRWQSWESLPDETSVDTWRGDQDLLANTQSGAALPVGELHVRRVCPMTGGFTTLATLHGGAQVLVRAPTDRGAAYFCGTTAAPANSSLANDGVVFYVAIQRALAAGLSVLGATHELVAGELALDSTKNWTRQSGAEGVLSLEYPAHAGVYAERDQLLAVNRGAAEDETAVVPDARVDELFRGLDFVRVETNSSANGSLAHEIWKLFMCTMMVAMLAEAGLCLPSKQRSAGTQSAGVRV